MHTRLGRHPILLFAIYRAFGLYAGRRVTATSELVIEGAPRSGTTFCYEAFLQVQARPVTVAYHLHLPAQVMRAVTLGVPTLVVIREPEAAVRSSLAREPYLTVAAALERYWFFYRTLEPLLGGFVVADFEEAVNRFGDVIRRVNARYGTRFAPFEGKNEDDVAAVFARLDQRHRRFGGGPEASYRPDPRKELAKAAVDLSGETQRLARCRTLYERWLRAVAAEAERMASATPGATAP
jgi:hypothetical protein